jgi:hypothetical protein
MIRRPPPEVSSMAIWVHIAPVIIPDGSEAKTALTKSLQTLLEKEVVTRIGKALPKDKFDPNPDNKPKGTSTAYNAIKIVAELTVNIASAGSKMTVKCTLNAIFEAIRLPLLKPGNLLGVKKMAAAADTSGKGDATILRGAKDALDAIVEPIVKEAIKHPRFNSYGKSMGLPL